MPWYLSAVGSLFVLLCSLVFLLVKEIVYKLGKGGGVYLVRQVIAPNYALVRGGCVSVS